MRPTCTEVKTVLSTTAKLQKVGQASLTLHVPGHMLLLTPRCVRWMPQAPRVRRWLLPNALKTEEATRCMSCVVRPPPKDMLGAAVLHNSSLQRYPRGDPRTDLTMELSFCINTHSELPDVARDRPTSATVLLFTAWMGLEAHLGRNTGWKRNARTVSEQRSILEGTGRGWVAPSS